MIAYTPSDDKEEEEQAAFENYLNYIVEELGLEIELGEGKEKEEVVIEAEVDEDEVCFIKVITIVFHIVRCENICNLIG